MTNVVQLQVEWRYRWTGGFCPLGALNGLPVRGADYTAHPAMERLLRLPDDADIELGTTEQTARRAWSDLLGGRPILLLRNPDQARTRIRRGSSCWKLLKSHGGSQLGFPPTVPTIWSKPSNVAEHYRASLIWI